MYANDLKLAVQCHTALSYCLDKMKEMDVDYPQLKTALTLATDGLPRNIAVKCQHGKEGTCHVTSTAGGIPEILELLEEAIDWLTEETELEGIESEETEEEEMSEH